MQKRKSSIKRYISLVVCIVMFLSIMQVSGAMKTNVKSSAKITLTSNDRVVAQEASNMTGVKVEDILKLRGQGKDWNVIMSELKKNKVVPDVNVRDKRLSNTGVGEEYVNELKKEGFTDSEITTARMIVERVVNQLSEITKQDESSGLLETNVNTQLPDIKTDSAAMSVTDDTTRYSSLSVKINIKTAVNLMLKLQHEKEFGSLEKVLDEYLYSLQIGVNLEIYLKDKKKYEKEKSQKSVELLGQEPISISSIEMKALQGSQKSNIDNKGNIGDETQNGKGDITKNLINTSNQDSSSVQIPEIKNSKPENPLDSINKELSDIKDKSQNIPMLNQGGK